MTGITPHDSGLVYDNIVVSTDNERFPELQIPVVLTIDGQFIREPRSIVQVLQLGATARPCHVKLRHATGFHWRLRGIETVGIDSQDVRIEKCDPVESVEKIIVITAIAPTNPVLSVKKGALLVKVVVGEETENIRIPVLFVWKD